MFYFASYYPDKWLTPRAKSFSIRMVLLFATEVIILNSYLPTRV